MTQRAGDFKGMPANYQPHGGITLLRGAMIEKLRGE